MVAAFAMVYLVYVNLALEKTAYTSDYNGYEAHI